MSIFKLQNTVINSDWGCPTSMSEIFGYANPDNKPMAELWMGAHPKAPSLLIGLDKQVPLDQYIAANPHEVLGELCAQRFQNRLPFLFKVLSAKTPLSIQSHPNKLQAEQGWAKENEQNIPLDAPHRNYKDDNHKPELVYAITEYHALNGFRELSDIINLFEGLSSEFLSPIINAFKQQQNAQGLADFYHAILTFSDQQGLIKEVVSKVALQLNTGQLTEHKKQAYQLLLSLNNSYANDIGALSALLLNYVILQPGEAMYLKAETLHAYLKGTALELMANSDNVLRGGLTPKHIDIPELLKSTIFEATPLKTIKLIPERQNNEVLFATPADDFKFSLLMVENETVQSVDNAQILFVTQGCITVTLVKNSNKKTLTINKGESCFIAANNTEYFIAGQGKVAKATAA